MATVMGSWLFWGVAIDKAPSFMPTGVASVVVSFFLSMYYNVINAWAFWYLFHSFQVSGPLAAWLGLAMATEGCGGFALVLAVAWHRSQLGMGGLKAPETLPGLLRREK